MVTPSDAVRYHTPLPEADFLEVHCAAATAETVPKTIDVGRRHQLSENASTILVVVE